MELTHLPTSEQHDRVVQIYLAILDSIPAEAPLTAPELLSMVASRNIWSIPNSNSSRRIVNSGLAQLKARLDTRFSLRSSDYEELTELLLEALSSRYRTIKSHTRTVDDNARRVNQQLVELAALQLDGTLVQGKDKQVSVSREGAVAAYREKDGKYVVMKTGTSFQRSHAFESIASLPVSSLGDPGQFSAPIAINHDGSLLAIGTARGQGADFAFLLDLRFPSQPRILDVPVGGPIKFFFSDDRRYAVVSSAGQGGSRPLYLFDLATPTSHPLPTEQPHQGFVSGYSSALKSFIIRRDSDSGANDRTLIRWNPDLSSTFDPARFGVSFGKEVCSFGKFSPDFRYVITLEGDHPDGMARRPYALWKIDWDLLTAKRLTDLDHDAFSHREFSPDSKFLVTTGSSTLSRKMEYFFTIYDLEANTSRIIPVKRSLKSLAPAKEARWIAAIDVRSGQLVIIDGIDGAVIDRSPRAKIPLDSVQLTGDDERLITQSDLTLPMNVQIWRFDHDTGVNPSR
jgi:hypothetical protein